PLWTHFPSFVANQFRTDVLHSGTIGLLVNVACRKNSGMTQYPDRVFIKEEGPQEGFQIEGGDIPTARKIALIDALSLTGLRHIQTVSFVNPALVPGMADAEQVVGGFHARPGVSYSGLWLNRKGLER